MHAGDPYVEVHPSCESSRTLLWHGEISLHDNFTVCDGCTRIADEGDNVLLGARGIFRHN